MSEPLDLGPAFRTAILANDAITGLLATWEGEPAVYTRRPVPDDAPYPLILIAPPASIGDADWLTVRIPRPRLDLIAYGLQPGDYRNVETIGYLLREQFHREPFSISVDGYSVLDIVANGPMPAPVDDQNEVGRAVLLTIRLRDLST
jgi:hypothetical protein